MSICRAAVSVLILTIAGCVDAPVATPEEAAVEQSTRIKPVCLAGDHLEFWTEASGVCGGCTIGSTPGQTWLHYAACANELDTTRTVIGSSCELPC